MYLKQLPRFKELNPYCGEIDKNNRWIRQFGSITKTYVQTKLPEDIHDIEVIEIDEM